MGFSEVSFIFIFLPGAIAVYLFLYALKAEKVQNFTLIIISICFYLWGSLNTFWSFLAIIVLAYISGRIVQQLRANKKQCFLYTFIASILFVLILFFYKYMPFVLQQFSLASDPDSIVNKAQLVAPIGISFITFAAISYVIDIYREEASAGSFTDVVLYFSLFPKLVSGPIFKAIKR